LSLVHNIPSGIWNTFKRSNSLPVSRKTVALLKNCQVNPYWGAFAVFHTAILIGFAHLSVYLFHTGSL